MKVERNFINSITTKNLKMKCPLIFTLLLITQVSKAKEVTDTVTFWTISYDKTVIISGNIMLARVPTYELTVKEGSLKNLIVSFVYDTGQPTTSSLEIKEKNEILRTIPHDPDMGPYFVVPIKEMIGTHQPNVRYELDFYYSDDRGQKNLKLGTIAFIMK